MCDGRGNLVTAELRGVTHKKRAYAEAVEGVRQARAPPSSHRSWQGCRDACFQCLVPLSLRQARADSAYDLLYSNNSTVLLASFHSEACNRHCSPAKAAFICRDCPPDSLLTGHCVTSGGSASLRLVVFGGHDAAASKTSCL